MDNVYVYLVVGHQSFKTGKTAIVSLPNCYAFIATYFKVAKEKVCERLGLDVEDVVILDSKFLGDDVLLIK